MRFLATKKFVIKTITYSFVLAIILLYPILSQAQGPVLNISYTNSPGVLDFGIVKVGVTKKEELRFVNPGSGVLSVNMVLPDSQLNFSPLSFSLAQFSLKLYDLEYTPSVEGPFEQIIEINTNDSSNPQILLIVKGTGVRPTVNVKKDILNYGISIRGLNIDSIRIPISNNSVVPLSIKSFELNNPLNKNIFVVSASSQEIAPSDSSSIFLKFIPSADKIYEDTLSIYSDAKNIDPILISIKAEAQSPNIVTNTNLLDFGNLDALSTSTLNYTIRNESDVLLVIDSVKTSQSGIFVPISNRYEIQGRDSLVLSLDFKPITTILYSDTLLIYNSDPKLPIKEITLSGTGIAPNIQISNPLSFDSVRAGITTTLSHTILNSGSKTLTISSVENYTDKFSSSLVPSNILGGDSLVFNINFTPDTLKSYSDSLLIVSNDPDTPNFILNVSGTGKAPEISASTDSLLFDITNIGSSSVLPITVYNNGTDILQVTSYTVGTSSYSVPVSPLNISIGDSQTVNVTFTPNKNIKNIDTLLVTTNSLSSPKLKIPLQGNNLGPVITSIPDTTYSEGESFNYNIVANDSDSNTLNFELITGPTGMSISGANKLLSWTIGISDSGVHLVSYRIYDEMFAADTQSFSVTVDSIVNSPFFLSTPDTTLHVDSLFNYTMKVASEGGQATYSMLVYPTTPDLMSLSDSTVSWTPTIAGFYDVIVRATDTTGANTLQQMKLNVLPDRAPTFNTFSKLTVFEDSMYTETISASDPEGGTIKYKIVNNSLSITIDSLTGEIKWLANNDDVGNHSIEFSATDSKNNKVTKQYSFKVVNTNDPPTITGINDLTVLEDAPTNLSFTHNDVDANDVLTFSDNTALFDVDSSGSISFTPLNADVGIHNISIYVKDSTVTDSLTFVLTIENTNDAPVLSPKSDITIVSGKPATIPLTGNDVDGDSLTYKIMIGPANAVINKSGVITWTPLDSDFGENNFKVRVTDPSAEFDEIEFKVNVSRENKAPIFYDVPAILIFEDIVRSYRLDQLAYDIDNNTNDLSWTIVVGDTVAVILNDSLLTFTPPANFSGVDTLIVYVTDPGGLSDTLSTELIVREINDPPIVTNITPSADTTITQNDTTLFEFSANDIETDSENLITIWFLEGDSVADSKTYQFIATPSMPNPVHMRLDVSDSIDVVSVSWTITIIEDIITDIDEIDNLPIPDDFVLVPAYPNPFNSSIKIPFGLPAASSVSLQIYNIKGQLVRNLFSGRLTAGYHTKIWNGKNELGTDIASGVYIVVFKQYNKGKMLAASIVLIK